MKQPNPFADLGIRSLYYKTNKTLMKEKYNTAAKAFFDLMDLKVGDKVKVLYKAHTNQWGWFGMWNDTRRYGHLSMSDFTRRYGHLSMSDFIGREGTVMEIGCNVVEVKVDTTSYWFPFYVIQPVNNLPEEIYLNDDKDYKATFTKNGDILVGGIDIEFDTLEDIYNKAKSLQ